MAGNKRLKWILSLFLGPVVFFVLLLASPETPTIDEIKQELGKFIFCFLILWIVGFGLVRALYALAGYVSKRSRSSEKESESQKGKQSK
ncbi:MAG: hypothetical protein ACYS80_24470 [Planctomycetota bacterium]|jgi:hypothetical protein